LVAGLLLGGPAWAGFAVEIAPARLELKVDPGKTVRAAIKLKTRGRGAQKVEVTKGHFGLDDTGTPHFDTPKDTSKSAAAWITVNQTEFTINPTQERILRMELTVPPGTPPGGYRATLYIAPPKGDAKSKDRGASVFLQGRLALIIYVTVGGAKPDGEIKAWEWRKLPPGKQESLALQVNNRGNAHLRLAGVVQVVDAQGQKYDAIVSGMPVLPGQLAWIPLDFQEKAPPPGSAVTIDGAIDLGQGEKRINARVGGRK